MPWKGGAASRPEAQASSRTPTSVSFAERRSDGQHAPPAALPSDLGRRASVLRTRHLHFSLERSLFGLRSVDGGCRAPRLCLWTSRVSPSSLV
ncbi:MAG: hypothetical protein OXG81_09075 [Acidobacteria bacterium]|nr:hypothetical protein [Acidobacteriota bacterium]